jgi:acetylornithine deacetylase/succinyl-diaminopimelate desuccinylase family protein
MRITHTPAEDILQDLIAIPSVTGSETPVAVYLERKFRELGLAVEMQAVDSDRYNVIGKVGTGPIGLMLCTHQDVIPALDVSGWETPPFTPSVRDGRIYGRGATDAKGSMAAMMEAMARVKGRIKGCAAIAAVVEEETGRSTGARKLLEAYTPAATVIGEPTGLRVAIAHKGAIRPIITVYGEAAHASRPAQGTNAISIAVKLIKTIESYGYRLGKHTDPLLGSSSSEVTMIYGGERINVVPESCTFFIDRRLVSGESIESAYDDLRRLVSRFSRRHHAEVGLDLLSAYPPSATDANEAIVQMSSAVLDASGLDPEPAGFPAGCDMWAFRAKHIPTVVIGPGSIEQAHVVDEYLDLGQLRKAVGVYERLLLKVLK